jgi:hypothetical protein
VLTTAVLQALASGGPDDVYPDPGAQAIRRMVFAESDGPVASLSGDEPGTAHQR